MRTRQGIGQSSAFVTPSSSSTAVPVTDLVAANPAPESESESESVLALQEVVTSDDALPAEGTEGTTVEGTEGDSPMTRLERTLTLALSIGRMSVEVDGEK